MKTYKTYSDMGTIKIFSDTMSAFFDNGVGDGATKVRIDTKSESLRDGYFLGHFTVKKENTVFLSGYDCTDDKMFEFSIGRWCVYRSDNGIMEISKIDTETQS